MVDTRPTSTADRWGIYMFVGAGAIAIVAVIWNTVARLIEVAPGRNIPVRVPLDQAGILPIGPGGASFDATVTEATVIVGDPAAPTLFALWAQPLVIGACLIGGIVVAALFCLRMARGHTFRPGTSALVGVGMGFLGAGWLFGSLLTQMSANGALAAVSDRSYDGPQFATDWAPAFVFLALAAIGIAFGIGERLHRDTEGLV